MYNYYELIKAVERLETLLNNMFTYFQSTLTPILYVLCFALFLKVAFTCTKGYKVWLIGSFQ